MGAEANGEEALDATSQNEEGQEGALPVTETAPSAEADPVGAGDASADLNEPEGDGGTAGANAATEARVAELERRLAEQDVTFKLTLAGARNVKAAQALLADHGGDVEKLKEAEPWLFETSQPNSQESKPKGKTGLPNAGAAIDTEKQMKHWREIAGLGEE